MRLKIIWCVSLPIYLAIVWPLCIASDDHHSEKKKTVNKEPVAPTNLLVREVWSRSAILSWTPPLAGNPPITGYIIHYWRVGENGDNKRLVEEQVSPSQTTHMLKNLLPGCSYEMSVIALNEIGKGPPSFLVKFKTGEEEPNGAPLDLITEPKGSKTIRVSWRAPQREKWNGELTGFYIGYKLTSEFNKPYSLRTLPAGNTNYTYEYLLQGLNKATEYSIIVKAHNAAGTGPDSQEMITRTLSGDLPPSPKVYLVTITTDSVSLMWKIHDNTYISAKISGFSVHYKPQYQSSWKEISVPVGMIRDEGKHILKGLEPNALYYIYVTAINNYGHGDPSELLTIKTRGFGLPASNVFNGGFFSSKDSLDLMTFQQEMLPFVSITIAVVIVIIVLICSYVCIKKAQLDASKPPMNLCVGPRSLDVDKGAVYVGTTHRYVDFDQRPLMQGNIAHLVDAQGNVYPAPFATLAPGSSAQNEEMKSFVTQSTPKPWQRPLPQPNEGQRKSMLQENVYDFPSQ